MGLLKFASRLGVVGVVAAGVVYAVHRFQLIEKATVAVNELLTQAEAHLAKTMDPTAGTEASTPKDVWTEATRPKPEGTGGSSATWGSPGDDA